MLEVQLHEVVDEVSLHLVPSPVHVAVPLSGTTPVVGTWEFDLGLRQPLVRDVAPRADPEAGEIPCRRHELGRPQTL